MQLSLFSLICSQFYLRRMSGHRTFQRTQRVQQVRSPTTLSKPPSLPAAKKKQLLQDIEDGGGLHVFSLHQLRLSRPDFYDNPEYVLRQVQNFVYRLKQLSDNEYLLKLSHYQVVASSRVSHFFASPNVLSPSSDSTSTQQDPVETSRPPTDTFQTPSEIPNSQFLTPPPRISNSLSRMNSSALALRPTHHDECEGLLFASVFCLSTNFV
jgi:hypothetical protein